MLLAIDVGNTQTHIGMWEHDRLVEHWRLASDREATSDRLATELAGLLSLRGLTLKDIDGAIVSAVVPVLAHEYELLSERYLRGALLMVGPGVKTGMPIRMDQPHEVGADRLVNAVAAFERVGNTCIAVDFGTAVNYDVVSSEGEYLGGVLAPGVEVSMDALANRAARLFKVDLETPPTVIGRSTHAALQSGIVFGFAGQVDGILGRVREELGEEATAIATGGHAAIIAPQCELIDEVDDLLTLNGLRLIWERNEG
ncbi:MAG: type III pantothenate kinase [Thermoleophilaceae bacterium]|nr:type III pantothenate kinase [Thermoleophilaceae bacterium]